MVARGMELVSGNRKHYQCPFCGSEQDIAMVGVRTTTQVSGCSPNFPRLFNGSSSKAIVFSDSVQDASYRAARGCRTPAPGDQPCATPPWTTCARGKEGVSFAEYLNKQNS